MYACMSLCMYVEVVHIGAHNQVYGAAYGEDELVLVMDLADG